LAEKELAEWQAMHAEQEYQSRLEALLSRLEPAYREPRAAKVLELLNRDTHTGESLYKIYELAEGQPSGQKKFRPVQVICIFHNALVRWDFQFFASLRLSWKERAHAQL
jgi:hypothetical protein